MFKIDQKHPFAKGLRSLFLEEQDRRQFLDDIARGLALEFNMVQAAWLLDQGDESFELLLGVHHGHELVNEMSAQKILDHRVRKFRIRIRVRMILMRNKKARHGAREVYRAYQW